MNHFANLQTKEERKALKFFMQVILISSSYLADLVDFYLPDKRFLSQQLFLNPGLTTEPAIAFRVFKELLVKNMVKKKRANVSARNY